MTLAFWAAIAALVLSVALFASAVRIGLRRRHVFLGEGEAAPMIFLILGSLCALIAAAVIFGFAK